MRFTTSILRSRRTLHILLAIASLIAITSGCGVPVESPPAKQADAKREEMFPGLVLPNAIHVGESAPVSLNGLQFSVAAQTNWRPPKRMMLDQSISADLEIHLRILNLTREPIVFPTFDTFWIVIRHTNGTIIPMEGGRDWTEITAPVMIPTGVGFSICRKAELRLNNLSKKFDFVYFDGTGTVLSVPSFTSPGNYKMSFQILSGDRRRTELHAFAQDNPIGGIRVWQGMVKTAELDFKLFDAELVGAK